MERLRLDDLLEPPEIAGPGFINLRLRNDWLAQQVQHDGRATTGSAWQPVAAAKTFVIDYSSPNVAKPMHVGHLRSTIIGDALARLLRFLGHRVITDNHLGDWGTQFGMLLYGYKHFRDEAAFQADPVREMARLYLEVRRRIKKGDEDDEAEDADRPGAGGVPRRKRPSCTPATRRICGCGRSSCRGAWRRSTASTGGWTCISTTRSARASTTRCLPGVVQDLLERGIAQESEGAVVIFFGENEPPVPRSASGTGPSPTRRPTWPRSSYRVEEWKPDAILYVVDSRQALHFKNLFDRPALGLRRSNWSTSPSARCWARIASRSRRAKAAVSSWTTCSTRRSRHAARGLQG